MTPPIADVMIFSIDVGQLVVCVSMPLSPWNRNGQLWASAKAEKHTQTDTPSDQIAPWHSTAHSFARSLPTLPTTIHVSPSPPPQPQSEKGAIEREKIFTCWGWLSSLRDAKKLGAGLGLGVILPVA